MKKSVGADLEIAAAVWAVQLFDLFVPTVLFEALNLPVSVEVVWRFHLLS